MNISLANAAAAEAEGIKPLAVTVPIALRITGLGRTTLYKLLDEGAIMSVTIGRRRLINFASLERLTSAAA